MKGLPLMPVAAQIDFAAAGTRTVSPAARALPDATRMGIREARWQDGKLVLTGFAHRQDRGCARRGSALTVLTLTRADGRRPVRVFTRPLRLPEATEESGQQLLNHDWSGFTAVIDPRRLRDGEHWQDGVWTVTATLWSGLRRRIGTLAPHWCGSGEYPPLGWPAPDVLAEPFFTDGELHLRLTTVRARITTARAVGDQLELTGHAHPDVALDLLRLHHRQTPTELACPVRPCGDGSFSTRVPLTELAAARLEGHQGIGYWDAELTTADGRPVRPVVDGQQLAGQYPLPGGERVLRLKRLADGRMQFCDQRPIPIVDRVTTGPDGFELAGSRGRRSPEPLELVLRHSDGSAEFHRPVHSGADGRFRLSVPSTVATSYGGRLPLRRGVWDLLLRPVDRPGEEQHLTLAPEALDDLPATARAGGKSVTLQRRWHETLILDSHPVLSPAERSGWAQARLRTEDYREARRRPLRQCVLYDVFGGRGYADSPRAVHEELVRRGAPLEHLWVVDDAQAELPPGLRTVRAYSPEWYEALGTSRYLVGNTHFPDFLHRRAGQTVVQTWHGGPLKRIAYDVENAWLADSGYLDQLDREAPNWSVLLSPSPFATPIMRRAFRFAGEVLESGYPRDDSLVTGDPAEAARIRARLGIPAGKRVVLYAPTWRDDHRGGTGYRLDLRIDLYAARRALGADHVLLVRPHAHVQDPLPGAGDGFLYNVGDYPDVRDLLLIADVLVTDYSSILFDFAITGRPMLFFTYDLEHYRDDLRGFYLDFEEHAPGPLLETSDQLIAALRDLPAATEGYAQRYRAFRRTFCGQDDGQASARVVDWMLAQ
ncbi:CDP-glycerol glycerophosphotransferase [Kitasatospora sp. MAA4]|uniref:CDP-glycerol glycerophosphotransferase family protein n=1 Tax=Kitasatospora sp. MAA4 TaxID=3035093 RepID=UPI0024740D51|nr:CDP-glycerol glycerophosphotransferase family protein [Kitasatospora sp. MAA4]MDH6135963.1 CDP-glycerol glycerophosphotransferase [Kitasatospora sp. MAA4]